MVWLVAAQALGHMVGLRLWGRVVDSHGGRPALSISLSCLAALGLAWAFVPHDLVALRIWALGFYFVFGFLLGGYMMGRTWNLISVVPPMYQTDAFTAANIANFTSGALGSLVGGLIFHQLTKVESALWGIEPTVIYLVAVQLLLLASWRAKHQLRHVAPQRSARELMTAVWRRVVARLSGVGRED